MIQRIQTIYLILAAGVLNFLFFAPLCEFQKGEASQKLYTSYILHSDGSTMEPSGSMWLLALAPLTMIAIAVMIFRYKNRETQMGMGRFIYLLLAAIITVSMFFIEWNKPEEVDSIRYGWFGYGAPVVSLVFVFLANRSIRNDEKLVKSLDRLR